MRSTKVELISGHLTVRMGDTCSRMEVALRGGGKGEEGDERLPKGWVVRAGYGNETLVQDIIVECRCWVVGKGTGVPTGIRKGSEKS